MRILLAVSGGIDSMYLANRAPELLEGAEFAVAHCNFHLRGQDSDDDESFVRDWSGAKGLPFFSIGFDTAAVARQAGISIEMAARELRYNWFAGICRKHGFDAVAVAHNANDNAETLLLNLLRGTGSKGLRGICGTSVMTELEDGPLKIIRPLLEISRDEIEAWMTAQGLGWREDRTNAASEFKRNRIRNMVFPLFKDINPSFIRTLGEDMERFREVDDIAEDYYLEALPSILGSGDGKREEFDLEVILRLKHWKYVLWRTLEHCSMSGPTFEKLTSLLEKYRELAPGTVTASGKTFQTPSCEIRIRKKKLVIVKK